MGANKRREAPLLFSSALRKLLAANPIPAWVCLLLDAIKRIRVVVLVEFDPIQMSPGMPSANGMRAIDRLKNAANLKPIKKTIVLSNGDEFEIYHKPLTMAQRERSQKNAKSDDAGAFALQLLVEVALDENGQRMFNAGDISELKHWVRDEDLQKLMLAVLSNESDEEEAAPTVDMKSTPARSVQG